LPTLRLTCRLHASIEAPTDEHEVDYADRNFPGRIGWREITAIADRGVLVSADVPAKSLSAGLTSYPEDVLQSPLDQRRAHLRFQPGDSSAGPEPLEGATGLFTLSRQSDRITQVLSSLVTGRSLTLAFVLSAFAMAMLLGAVHALGPGHGKSVMAAYLVGQKGSLQQALAIGLTVTATHTAGVIGLGVLVSTSSAMVPERFYPWLSLASGLLLASVGAGLLKRTLRDRAGLLFGRAGSMPNADRIPALAVQRGTPGQRGAASSKLRGGAGLAPEDAEPQREHDHNQHLHVRSSGAEVGWRSLVTVGFAGGMVPTPSALVVLLAAIALGRAWLGVALVFAYGFGMAATLIGSGLLLVHLRDTLDRSTKGRGLERVGHLLPLTTAAAVLAVGLLLAARAAAQL
jgi:ABC-type nickel/cobalt efflux system permease component RcnA